MVFTAVFIYNPRRREENSLGDQNEMCTYKAYLSHVRHFIVSKKCFSDTKNMTNGH